MRLPVKYNIKSILLKIKIFKLNYLLAYKLQNKRTKMLNLIFHLDSTSFWNNYFEIKNID